MYLFIFFKWTFLCTNGSVYSTIVQQSKERIKLLGMLQENNQRWGGVMWPDETELLLHHKVDCSSERNAHTKVFYSSYTVAICRRL